MATDSKGINWEDAFAHFYDAVDKAQRIDNTGGDSAVSVELWSWSGIRALAAPEETLIKRRKNEREN